MQRPQAADSEVEMNRRICILFYFTLKSLKCLRPNAKTENSNVINANASWQKSISKWIYGTRCSSRTWTAAGGGARSFNQISFFTRCAFFCCYVKCCSVELNVKDSGQSHKKTKHKNMNHNLLKFRDRRRISWPECTKNLILAASSDSMVVSIGWQMIVWMDCFKRSDWKKMKFWDVSQ